MLRAKQPRLSRSSQCALRAKRFRNIDKPSWAGTWHEGTSRQGYLSSHDMAHDMGNVDLLMEPVSYESIAFFVGPQTLLSHYQKAINSRPQFASRRRQSLSVRQPTAKEHLLGRLRKPHGWTGRAEIWLCSRTIQDHWINWTASPGALGPWTGWRGGWDEMRCARRPLIVMALSMSPVLRDPSSVPPQPLSNAPVGRLTRALSTEAAPSGVPPAAGPGYLSRGAISQPLRRYLSRHNRRESSRARP